MGATEAVMEAAVSAVRTAKVITAANYCSTTLVSRLVDRCVDGHMFGGLPRCPECGGGLLRVVYAKRFGHSGQGKFSTPSW